MNTYQCPGNFLSALKTDEIYYAENQVRSSKHQLHLETFAAIVLYLCLVISSCGLHIMDPPCLSWDCFLGWQE